MLQAERSILAKEQARKEIATTGSTKGRVAEATVVLSFAMQTRRAQAKGRDLQAEILAPALLKARERGRILGLLAKAVRAERLRRREIKARGRW